jgi:hypothetical protein
MIERGKPRQNARPKFCHGLKCMFMAVLALKTVEYATSQEKARRMCNIISHQIGRIHQ